MIPRFVLLAAAAASYALAEVKQLTTTDGYNYEYDYVPAEDDQPTVLFVHGFPSGRGDWRHQIENLTSAGYGILAPDCLGYGGSDKPQDVEEYNLKKLAGHMAEIIDNEGLDTVVGVGHDWGSSVLSNTAVYHPEKFSKLAFVSVSYNPPGPFDVDALNAQSLQQVGYTYFGYWYFFNAFRTAQYLHEHLESYFHLVYPTQPSTWRDHLAPINGARVWLDDNTTTSLAAYLTEEDKADWLCRYSTVEDHTAGLNYYRSIFAGVQVADYEALTFEDLLINVPVLTIVGADDAIANPENMGPQVEPFALKGVTSEIVEGGHWPMLESKDDVNAILNTFLETEVEAEPEPQGEEESDEDA